MPSGVYKHKLLQEPIERFKKLNSLQNGCMVWQGCLNKDGYGNFWMRTKFVKAHRFAYEYYVGKILKGLVIDHICRNRACVNPKHLRQITSRQNVLENSRGVAITNLAKTHCKRGHPFFGKNLMLRNDGHRDCRTCVNKGQKEWRKNRAKIRAGSLSTGKVLTSHTK